MSYRNQLVATGQLNDVGTALRTNVARSYRRGVELSGFVSADDKISLSSTPHPEPEPHSGLPRRDATTPTTTAVVAAPRTSTISYSPAVVSAHTLEGQPLKGLRLALLLQNREPPVPRQLGQKTAAACSPTRRSISACATPCTRVYEGN